MSVALKEWAAVADALARGTQCLTLRKGGISEDEGEFQPQHNAFYLFPTYEHQKRDAIDPDQRPTAEPWLVAPAAGKITLRVWARVEAIWKVTNEPTARALARWTLWTPEAAAARFHLYPHKPFFCLALRAYELKAPLTIPEDPSYAGCRSWVPLVDLPEPNAHQLKAALEDTVWSARLTDIRRLMADRSLAE